MDFNNIGYTNKKQFIVYIVPNIYIKDDYIFFENEVEFQINLNQKREKNTIVKWSYKGKMFNYYEEFKEKNIHIFEEFNNILDNNNLDNNIIAFIKKYGFLYNDSNIISLYKSAKNPSTMKGTYKVKKTVFVNELYIFKCLQELYHIISFYMDKTDKNIELEHIKHWKLAFDKIVNYLYKRYDKTKQEIKNTFPNLANKFVLTKEVYERIVDLYTILLNCYLENFTVKALTYTKNEFITCLIPKDLIDIIYFDYFDYISNNGKNREVRMCEECNKIFYVDKTDGNDFRRKYCSIKCSKKYNAKKSNEKPIYKLYRSFYQKNHQNKHITFKQFNDWQEKALLLKKKCENKEITYKQYEDEMNELQNSFLKGDVKNGSIRKDKK